MTVLTVPKPLRERLGDEVTDSLVELLNQVADRTKEDVIALVAEKFERKLGEELAQVRVDMAAMRAELREEIVKLRTELHNEILTVRTELHDEISKVRTELHDEISRVRTELHDETSKVRTDLQVQIANTRSELIRWMFIFWVGQLAVITGLFFAFLRQ